MRNCENQRRCDSYSNEYESANISDGHRSALKPLNVIGDNDFLQEPIFRAKKNGKPNHKRTMSLPAISFAGLCSNFGLNHIEMNLISETTDCSDSEGKVINEINIDILDESEDEIAVCTNVNFDNDGDVDIFTDDKNFHVYKDGWVVLASEMKQKSALKKVFERFRDIALHD